VGLTVLARVPVRDAKPRQRRFLIDLDKREVRNPSNLGNVS